METVSTATIKRQLALLCGSIACWKLLAVNSIDPKYNLNLVVFISGCFWNSFSGMNESETSFICRNSEESTCTYMFY